MDGMDFAFDDKFRALQARLDTLETEHRKIDDDVARLHNEGGDMLRIQRLKRQKLKLKDEIVRLRGLIYPNIIA